MDTLILTNDPMAGFTVGQSICLNYFSLTKAKVASPAADTDSHELCDFTYTQA